MSQNDTSGFDPLPHNSWQIRQSKRGRFAAGIVSSAIDMCNNVGEESSQLNERRGLTRHRASGLMDLVVLLLDFEPIRSRHASAPIAEGAAGAGKGASGCATGQGDAVVIAGKAGFGFVSFYVQ